MKIHFGYRILSDDISKKWFRRNPRFHSKNNIFTGPFKKTRSYQPPLFHTHIAGPRHNDMIDQLDAENGDGLLQLGGDSNVLAAGRKGTLGVVMHADDRCSPVRDRVGKDLPGVHEAVV